jgi:hypothetical protein
MERLLRVEFGPLALEMLRQGRCAATKLARRVRRERARPLPGHVSACMRGRPLQRSWPPPRAGSALAGNGRVRGRRARLHLPPRRWPGVPPSSSTTSGECRERFQWGVMPRCALCPLFDSERAIRAGMCKEPVLGERSQAAFDLHDAALIVGPDYRVSLRCTDTASASPPGLRSMKSPGAARAIRSVAPNRAID